MIILPGAGWMCTTIFSQQSTVPSFLTGAAIWYDVCLCLPGTYIWSIFDRSNSNAEWSTFHLSWQCAYSYIRSTYQWLHKVVSWKSCQDFIVWNLFIAVKLTRHCRPIPNRRPIHQPPLLRPRSSISRKDGRCITFRIKFCIGNTSSWNMTVNIYVHGDQEHEINK